MYNNNSVSIIRKYINSKGLLLVKVKPRKTILKNGILGSQRLRVERSFKLPWLSTPNNLR